MRALSVSVFQVMKRIDQSAGHKFSVEQWANVHKKTKRWLVERGLVGTTPQGMTFLSKRGDLLLNSARVVDFWARSM